MRFTSGLPETRCGAGSTFIETSYLRLHLRLVFEECGIKVLLDAPCGDFNWMRHVDLTGVRYIGLDNDVENLEAARAAEPELHEFRIHDIIKEALPFADAMLCRDFHQHLPNALVIEALRNFLPAGIDWLMATTHANAVNYDIAEPGMFRPINLRAAPFNLPEPNLLVSDPPRSGHFLGVWSRAEVAGAIG